MGAPDQTLDVRVPDEPEDEIPIGTTEGGESESDGLAVEPYAEELPFEPARVRVSRPLVIGIIVVLIVALLILMAVTYARGSWWYLPQPTWTNAPFSPTSLP